ncbi:DNA-directed RNA polymerase I subunit RPA49 [Salminus brasiliensis]|uniref:DNA-directed RNA polymerase I subunit RPA49 n=1 Tax=Salminus brasiliensis TaxID=930266 RepID=UPI003B83778D
MAATCVWKPCEENGQDHAVIVKFSNGHVKNTDQLDFKLFKHVDESNPRKKSRRIVAAESDRLAYVGSNFGTGSLQCNNLCRYFVGVLDKRTMEMKVQSAQLFNLQPIIPGETTTNADKNETKTYRDKVDALIEAFGTTKQKRALSSRRLNEVGNETLQKAVARAAGNVIDQKGLEALQQEVANSEAQTEIALFLPPCNRDADKAEDVYPFSGILSPVEFESLKQVGEKMAALTSEDLVKMRNSGSPETVLRHLESLPNTTEARERQARCAWYLLFLIRLARHKKVSHKLDEDDCPRSVYTKVLKTFTVESYANGRLRNTVPASMLVKLACHCLALLLHMGGQTANLTLLHRDLSLSENRMLEVAKAMGLTLSRQSSLSSEESGLRDDHRMASLELPLVHYERRLESRKRKKMK